MNSNNSKDKKRYDPILSRFKKRMESNPKVMKMCIMIK